jgi:hypothetical protein
LAEFFGFEIRRRQTEANTTPSIIAKESDDGAVVVQGGGAFGTYVDLDGAVRTEAELVTRYRTMAEYPDVDAAIEDIVNESIVYDQDRPIVSINMDELEQPDRVKKIIKAEFDYIIDLLEFNKLAYDLFRRWYVDGRLFFHVIIDVENPTQGIKELRYIDSRKIRKVREVRKTKDTMTTAQIVKSEQEYFLFNERGFMNTGNYGASGTQAFKIAKDSIVLVPSGMMDKHNTMMLSYLHKSIKVLNQLKALEDATVIYRISRAPERRVFYIDVGNLPKMKAEQYLKDVMTRFKNKLVYDASTGEIRDDRKFMTMLEDFWLPRREGGKGTEITTLPAGQNLGEIEDVRYFQKKLFKSLNVPFARMENEGGSFLMGRSAEITRDEIKFQKFIDRLRLKFSALFLKTLEKQLLLKGIVTPDDWILISQKLKFDYARDNYYAELKEAEIINNRVATLQGVQPYIGKFYSNKWVQQNVLRMTDEEMEEERAQIVAEQSDPIFNPPMPEGLDMGQPEEQPEDEQQNQAAAQQQTQQPATQDKPFTQPKTG